MKLNLALYIISISLYSISSPLFAYESEMRVYDIKTHAALGFYQRMGTIDGCESIRPLDYLNYRINQNPYLLLC